MPIAKSPGLQYVRRGLNKVMVGTAADSALMGAPVLQHVHL